MGFKSNGIEGFDIDTLIREQEEKQREKQEEKNEQQSKDADSLDVQNQEEAQVVELQDTPDGLEMLGTDGSVISQEDEEEPVEAESQALEEKPQEQEGQDAQDEVSRLLQQIYADEEAAAKEKEKQETQEEPKEKKKTRKKKLKSKTKSNGKRSERAGYSSSIYGRVDEEDDEENEGENRIKKIMPIAAIAILVFAIAALVMAGISAAKNSKKDEEETTSYDQSKNPLQEDVYEEISDVVKLYYQAKVAGDVEALAQYVDNMEDITAESLATESSYINEYSSISCYTKNGLYANTYVVYVYYELSIKNISTMAPGISILYVIRDDETGNIYIHNGVTEKEVLNYIQMISQDDDVLALYADVNNELNAALAADASLKAFYDALANNSGKDATADNGEGAAQQ